MIGYDLQSGQGFIEPAFSGLLVSQRLIQLDERLSAIEISSGVDGNRRCCDLRIGEVMVRPDVLYSSTIAHNIVVVVGETPMLTKDLFE